MPEPSFLSWGSTPHRTDTVNTLLKRIAGGIANGGGGGGGSGGVGLYGVVDPNTLVTATPGTTYVNTANHTFWLKESGIGNTGWTQYV